MENLEEELQIRGKKKKRLEEEILSTQSCISRAIKYKDGVTGQRYPKL
jgi:hypothetical protein